MNDRLEQDLDEMLSRHLHACLDGQLGRAALALRHELSPRPRWRLWTAAATAIAAGLAVAIIVIAHRTPLPKIVKDPTEVSPPIVEAAVPVVQSATWSKLTDDGTTLVDDRPMRRMRRKVVNEVEWYDAKNGATIRTTQPQQQIYLIELKTN
jgi:hypothetical protein